MQNHVHKTSINLKNLSHEVFDLDKQYKTMLQGIAISGPLNEAKIQDFIDNSDDEEVRMSRPYLHRRLVGSSKIFGLQEKEYLFSLGTINRRWGEQQNYHLTVKGILAVLSSGISFKKIYLVDEFLSLASIFLRYRKILAIIEELIKNEILAFLAWHAFNGIQLQKLVNSQKYYENINSILWNKDIDWGRIDEKVFQELQKIWRSYHISQDAISILQKETDYVINKKDLNSKLKKEIPSLFSNVIWKVGFHGFIFNWPIGMANLYHVNYDKIKILYREKLQKFSFDMESNKVMKLVKSRLIEKGYSTRDCKILDL